MKSSPGFVETLAAFFFICPSCIPVKHKINHQTLHWVLSSGSGCERRTLPLLPCTET